ncbi:MAG: glyoxalase, partial [Flavobacterium psychrophilum]
MFKNTKAFSGYSVDDTARAKAFYSDILGIEVKEGEMGILELHTNG